MSYWLERILGEENKAYVFRASAVVASWAIALVITASVAHGLPRLEKDLGFPITIVGDLAVILSVKLYLCKFRKVLDSLPRLLRNYSAETSTRMEKTALGNANLVCGIASVVVVTLLSFLTANPVAANTGMFEMPYLGGYTTSMVYTSIPVVVVVDAGWIFMEFVGGGVFWLCVSAVLVMRRVSMSHEPEIGFIEVEEEKRKMLPMSRLPIFAIAMPAAGASYAPTALARVSVSSSIAPVYYEAYATYVAFATLVFFLSMWYFHIFLDRSKKNKVKEIQTKLAEYYGRDLYTALNDPVVRGFLDSLHRFEERVSTYPSWPFSTESVSNFLALVVAPVAVGLLLKLLV